MIEKSEVEKIVREYIANTSIFPVNISVSPGGDVIHIQIDKPEGISIEECADLNRFLIERLARDTEDYELEVSSPGLGSPLKVLPQYIKNIGRTVEVIKKDGAKIKGILLSADNQTIEIKTGQKTKTEGKKRFEIVFSTQLINMHEIKSTKVLVSFK